MRLRHFRELETPLRFDPGPEYNFEFDLDYKENRNHDWYFLNRNRDWRAFWKVFFVGVVGNWILRGPRDDGNDPFDCRPVHLMQNGIGETLDGITLIEDTDARLDIVLAHEFVHALGFHHHDCTDPAMLMPVVGPQLERQHQLRTHEVQPSSKTMKLLR